MAEVLDHSPVVIDKFSGYWAKSHPTIRPYITPQGYSWDCLNIRWSGEAIGSRQGIDFQSSLDAAIGTIQRVQLYNKISGNRLLVMDTTGSIYDTGSAAPGTPIIAATPVLAADNFNRANANTLGANWTILGGFINNLGIFNNAVDRSPDGSAAAAYYSAVGVHPDNQYSQVKFVTLTSIQAAVVRGSTAAQTLYAGGYNDSDFVGTKIPRIWKYIAGVITSIATGTGTIAAGDTIKLVVQGTSLSLYVNGILRASGTDASIASGKAGILNLYTVQDVGLFDDFEFGGTTGASPGDDFSAITINDRAYITIHDRVSGKISSTLYVYDGVTARAAAGVAPTTNPGAANGAAGVVEAGIHLIAFAWETSSGFITKYGPAIQYSAPGALKINVTSVSNGGSGTAAKHILATKVIPNYDGNQNNYEFFFVPNGKINDNVTTSITIDFLDSQLVDSGDTLLDQLDIIPAGVFLCEHEGRLVSGGENGFESFARVSNSAKPESFSSIDGFIKCSPGDGGGLKNGRSFRGNLYLFKSNRTYAAHDNGGSPSEWPISLIDGGIGAEAFSIADVLDSKTFTRSMLFVLGKSGLQPFDGSYSQLPMSYNQDADLQTYFNDKSSLVANPVTKEIYVILDGHPSKYILMYNYADGLSYDRVRCSPWVFSSPGAGQDLAIKNIIIGVDGTIYLTSSTINEIYYLQYPMVVNNLVNDDGRVIIAYYTTHLVVADDGTEVHLALARVRAKSNIKASSNLIATVYNGETAGLAITKAIPNVPMDEHDYPFNIVSRLGIGLRIGSTELDHDWFVGRILLFMKKNAKAKPA